MADSFTITNGKKQALQVIYQYDDTFEGLMTAIFESYVRKPTPSAIVGQQHQQQLGACYEVISTDYTKAERVIAGIEKKAGGDIYERVWTGFLSCRPDKSDVIYRYIRLAMQLGTAVRQHITDERVMAMDKLASQVGRESGKLIEFVRFSRMEGGVYYAKITPEHNVIPLMMPFFAERFNIQPFLIHDVNRQMAGIYDQTDWFITSTEGFQLPDYAEDEKQYRMLWKRFYDTIAIKERINPNLRRQLMPKKYWRNITEMSMTDSEPSTSLPSDISRAAALNSIVAPPQAAFDSSNKQAAERKLNAEMSAL